MHVFLQVVVFSLQTDGSGRPVLPKGSALNEHQLFHQTEWTSTPNDIMYIQCSFGQNERAVFDQTYNRMMDLGLYPLFQSAYRKGHSTETAL